MKKEFFTFLISKSPIIIELIFLRTKDVLSHILLLVDPFLHRVITDIIANQ